MRFDNLPDLGYFCGSIKLFSMRQIAFREALREAMNEEMRRDDRVFLMGEEVAEYNEIGRAHV